MTVHYRMNILKWIISCNLESIEYAYGSQKVHQLHRGTGIRLTEYKFTGECHAFLAMLQQELAL